MVMGDNGIIAKAQTAKEKTNEAQKYDEDKVKELEDNIDVVLSGPRTNIETVTAYTGTSLNNTLTLDGVVNGWYLTSIKLIKVK